MNLILSLALRWAAPVLLVLAVVGGLYMKGRIDANHANEVKALEQSLADANNRLALEKQARIADAYRAAAASKRLGSLTQKTKELEEYVDRLEDADRQCLSADDTDRLRDLWN